jgi:hypothetical protein
LIGSFLSIYLNMLRQTPENKTWVPFDIDEELRRRAELLQKAALEPKLQVALRELCRLDSAVFINNFCWIFEPRTLKNQREHNLPWVLYPHEYQLLDYLDERYRVQEDGLVEKSRDMGVTWTVCAWMLWKWMSGTEFTALIGSRKEDLVDNGLVDSSIFGKFDYLLEHLPPWLLPQGYEKKKHRMYMKLINPETGNSLTGESTNPAFSRSGRYSMIFLDEFAYVDKSFSIWQAAGDSTNVRIPVSTPQGKGNKFADLALGPMIKKLSLHWRLHPEKDEEWYQQQKKRRTNEEIAEELDISYERSQRGRVFQDEWQDLIVDGRLNKEVLFDPLLPVDTSWDFGLGDATAIGFFQLTKEGNVRMIDHYENSGYDIFHYLKIIQAKPYRYAYHYGDITIKKKDLTGGRSVWEILRDNNVRIIGQKIRNKRDTINASKIMMRTMWVKANLTKFVDAIENYHFQWDEDKQVYSEQPVHDWSSHSADMLGYYAFNRRAHKEKREQKPIRNWNPHARIVY